MDLLEKVKKLEKGLPKEEPKEPERCRHLLIKSHCATCLAEKKLIEAERVRTEIIRQSLTGEKEKGRQVVLSGGLLKTSSGTIQV